MEPEFSKHYADREECAEEDSWYLEDYDIIQTIERNFADGFYRNQRFAFNPLDDEYNDGYDWRNNEDEDMKVPFPPEMFVSLEGEMIDVPSWDDGIPDDLQPVMKRLYNLLEE